MELNYSSEERKIEELFNWDKNPRTLSKERFAELKAQIQKLGVYKPLIITEQGEVLGGNMRLRALKDLGVKNVWVSVVKADNDDSKLEYALSDNDNVGQYHELELSELLQNSNIDMSIYKAQLGEGKELAKILEQQSTEPDFVPELEFSEELLLEHNYIVLYFDNNMDWQVAMDKFNLAKVKTKTPEGSQKIGIGRVVKGKEWLDRIN